MSEQAETQQIIGGVLLLNTLFESQDVLSVRLQKNSSKIKPRKLKDWNEIINGLKDKGYLINIDESFKLGSNSESDKETQSQLKNLHFPKCQCALYVPNNVWNEVPNKDVYEDLFRNIVYNECNSVSEIYNRASLFFVTFLNQEVSTTVLRENRLDYNETLRVKVSMIVGLELEEKNKGSVLHSVSSTLILVPSENSSSNRSSEPEGPFGYYEFGLTQQDNDSNINDLLQSFQKKIGNAFHMRKNLMEKEDYKRLKDLIYNSFSELGRELSTRGLSAEDLTLTWPKGDNEMHDLHDLQIYSILMAFKAFLGLENENDEQSMYKSMRDDLRSNAFTSILCELPLSAKLSTDERADFIASLMEGFPVKLREDPNEAIKRYRVGYEDKNLNIFLSWNNLLILDEREKKPVAYKNLAQKSEKEEKKNESDGQKKDTGEYGYLKMWFPRAFLVNLLAGELMDTNSVYTELLKQMRSETQEINYDIRKLARKIYVETALLFDLGYVQTPLIRKILQVLVEQYGFKSTLEGLRSTLSALDTSASAEAVEGLNVIIIIIGVVTIMTTILPLSFTEKAIALAILIILLAPFFYVFRDALKSIYWYRSFGKRGGNKKSDQN